MKYGVIGERLGHSFSKEIHAEIADYVYEIMEIPKDGVDDFMEKKDFLGINVTIPYKEKVMPHLDFISDEAKRIGAVNTVVNRGGKLYGYNTDYEGMRELILRVCGDISGKKVLILGNGGTSKTTRFVASDMHAGEIYNVVRTERDGCITYAEAYSRHTDADIIINTTPVGMYPNGENEAFDISNFNNLCGVVDAVYNPIRTRLVMDAAEHGIRAEGGLFMLCAQAVYASAIFKNSKPSTDITDSVYAKILKSKENIVLIGMPSSGKSTAGRKIAEITGKKFVDTDDEFVKMHGDISAYFSKYGEAEFRKAESEIIKKFSEKNNLAIATGGGCILSRENMKNLKSNGVIYFLNRSLENLIPTSDRPLSSDRKSLEKRYSERYPMYIKYADRTVDANGSIADIAKEIKGDFFR